MKVGDLVKHFLTEQIGIIVATHGETGIPRVLWTTQGDSLFGPGNKQWCDKKSLDLLTSS